MISKIISTYLADGLGFLTAAYLIPGFDINLNNYVPFLLLVAVFAAIHIVIQPIIKLILSPLILITFGLFNLVITGALLYIVDIYSQYITITGFLPLLYGTLIITIANIILNTGHRIFRN
jgi:uncharacterized membrane protein YvlD (DUF360 family)